VEVEVTSDIRNELLGRREVQCLIRSVYGHFSRSDAVQAVSEKLKATDKAVYAISIDGGSGTRDAKGLFYIYSNEEDAEKDLPKYILKRNAGPAAAPEEAKAKPETPEAKKAEPEKPEESKDQPKTTEEKAEPEKPEQAKPEKPKGEEVKAEPEETKTQPEKPEESSKEPSEAPKEKEK
jgi:ribosomal protein S24E